MCGRPWSDEFHGGIARPWPLVDLRCPYGSRVTPVAPRPLHEIVEAGWAKALEPVAGRIAEMGDFLRAEIAAGRTYLPALRECSAGLPTTLRRRTGTDRRSGPVSDAGARGGAVVLGGARGSSAARQSAQHLPRAEHRPGARAAVQRRPDAVDAAGCAVAQQGADHRAAQARRAPRQGLGGGHRAGHPRPGRAREAPGVRPVGPGRPQSAPATGQPPVRGVLPPSPMSADRGFFGSRPFSRANDLLVGQGGQPVDWRLP